MVKKNNNRGLWADAMRAIAIYLVVHLHTSFTPIDKISVPLFVMVSGALLLQKKEPYKLFFKKRIVKVLIPWIVWTIIYMIYFVYFFYDYQTVRAEYFKNGLENAGIAEYGRYFIRMLLSALWFLPMIFSLYLLTPLLRTIVQGTSNFVKYYTICMWFLVFSLFPFLFDNSLFPKYQPNIIFTALQYSGYFILGFLLIKLKPTRKIIIFFSGLFIIAGLLMKRESGFIDPTTFFAATAFFYLVFAMSNKIEKKLSPKLKNVIMLLSGASLGIYVLHGLLAGIFSKQIQTIKNIGIFEPLILFIVSALIILLLQRVPLLRRIVP